MAITAVDKIKINKYLKEHAIEDIYYNELCETLSKKEKITHIEFLEYFTDCVINEFNKNEKISIKHLSKIMFLIQCFISLLKKSEEKIKEETLYKIVGFKDFYLEYLKRNKLEIDQEFNDSYIKVVVRMASKLAPIDSKKETTIKLINKIKEIEEEFQKIQKQLATLTEEYEKISTSNNKKTKKIESLNEKITLLEQEKETKDDNLNKLINELTTLKNRINELEIALLQEKEETRN